MKETEETAGQEGTAGQIGIIGPGREPQSQVQRETAGGNVSPEASGDAGDGRHNSDPHPLKNPRPFLRLHKLCCLRKAHRLPDSSRLRRHARRSSAPPEAGFAGSFRGCRRRQSDGRADQYQHRFHGRVMHHTGHRFHTGGGDHSLPAGYGSSPS